MNPQYIFVDSEKCLDGGTPYDFQIKLNNEIISKIKSVKLCNISMLNSHPNLFPYFYIDIEQFTDIHGMITPNSTKQTFVVFTIPNSKNIDLSYQMSTLARGTSPFNALNIKLN